MSTHQYFPPEILALQEEMFHHPDVAEAMSKVSSPYFEDRLAALCTHLGMQIDGEFDVDEICFICDKITAELYKKRTGIVISAPSYQD